jgi:YD repeat-containing protein
LGGWPNPSDGKDFAGALSSGSSRAGLFGFWLLRECQHSTFFTYNALGRVTNANFPNSQSETYAYDADNNLTSKTDRKNQTITYLYDDLNRLTSKAYPDRPVEPFMAKTDQKACKDNDAHQRYQTNLQFDAVQPVLPKTFGC